MYFLTKPKKKKKTMYLSFNETKYDLKKKKNKKKQNF